MAAGMTELIVALDGPDNASMSQLVVDLVHRTPVRFFKLTAAHLMRPGTERLVRTITCPYPNHDETRSRLFLDLKVYDTPDTVRNVTRAAFDLGAAFLTVHGSPSVIDATMRAKPDDRDCKVLAVGPTSDWSHRDYRSWIQGAQLCDGVICPAAYADRWATYLHYHDKLVVCPGVRSPSDDRAGGYLQPDDHHRIMAPKPAMSAGADYIIVGRPIWQAVDPVAATQAILAEMA
jgi:orotidine-5'-phosphate decarboxylase